eukprot:CAMPEP_0196803146 /NCGR_PEP_ID=MMETSP1362-20130617/2559_1 /TAXON_ID=163516 /ORGANISM="Leptocylindrus danicus, Strain CCMP1856" /LENGTH=918 /DNA_ID=CAMNT_0042174591 /DNA_START=17 /DNA_END=2769 /DNA_ORIENTATION=-
MKEALEAIVPAYCSNAHLANFTFSDLLRSVLSQSVEDMNKPEIYGHFVSALSLIPNNSPGMSSLLASLLANAAFDSSSSDDSMNLDNDGDDSPTEGRVRQGKDATFVLDLMQRVPCMVSATSSLLRYIRELLFSLSGNEESTEQMDLDATDTFVSLSVPCSELMGIAVNGPSEKTDISGKQHTDQVRRSLMLFTTNLITFVRDGLMNPNIGRLMKSRDEKYAKLCLNLWQDLMQLHADALSCRSEILQQANSGAGREVSDWERTFWDAAPTATQDCVDRVQRLLPTPHFLVSITSLLQEKDGDVALQRRALRLLGERASEIDPLPSAKASLFLETVPDLTNLLGGNISCKNGEGTDQDKSQQARRNIVLQQAALMAIEQLAGHLCGESFSSEEISVFVPSVSKICTLMAEATDQSSNDHDGDEDAMRQLLSSAALSAATLISILKVRCLPFLPKLIKPLLSALCFANKSSTKDDVDHAAINILYRAIVRCFVAIVETLPQFLSPYLDAILSPDTLLSQAIRECVKDDSNMAALIKRFDEGLATKVPPRLLLPAASEVVTRCLDDNGNNEGNVYWREAIAVIGIITISIRSCSRTDLPSVIVKVMSVAMSSFSYSKLDGRFELLDAANKALLSLVMKMSEAQLRPLYSRLREWRGDLVKDEDDNESSIRRFSFWSMTAVLCKELRGIFLPCMSSVVGDIVQELELAVSKFCTDSSGRMKSARKRRRVSEEESINIENLESWRPIQPVLLCLETALKADAHEGGEWIRAEDSQRYHKILKPLSKLLLSRIPESFPLIKDGSNGKFSAYEMLIGGKLTLEYGNVGGCMTALSAAAGNEQLWKPLNHAILTACGHETRTEVRRVGISALLSVLRTLGEEYMILLPECLPVLSELLEDRDEGIARMAKECVQLGEDLLGENLA